MLAAITKRGSPGSPAGGDARPIHSEMSSTVPEEQTPLPEDQAGAVVVVDSKQYVLGEKLGRGGGGSVFAATLKRAADVREVTDGGFEDSDSHTPESMALKLVGGVGDAELRGVDARLAAVAVEAVAAAE
eukprot:4334072-Amphidinium_carterae.1